MMDEQSVAQYWDQNAPAWVEGVRSGYDIYRQYIANPAFFGMLPNLQGLDLLDVGCGEGYNTRKFADLGAKVTGIDISEKLIEAAREQETNHAQRISYFVCSGSYMACFEDGLFDAVVSTMALMDMPDYEGCISEVRRVLKDGGLFQFSILHPFINIRQFKWLCNEQNVKKGAEVGDYFGLRVSDDSSVEKWTFSGSLPSFRKRFEQFQIPCFFRTLSQYYNCLTKNGFNVLQIQEPYANECTVKEFPQMEDSRTVPYFLIFQCRKNKIL